MHGWVSFLRRGHSRTFWADAATWRESYSQWFRSLDTCIMLVSQALWLSLQVWRFVFFLVCKTDSRSDWKWFTVGCTICFQDTITILICPPLLKRDPNSRKKASKTSRGSWCLVTNKTWATCFRWRRRLSRRHVTKSNGVVGPKSPYYSFYC